MMLGRFNFLFRRVAQTVSPLLTPNAWCWRYRLSVATHQL